MLTVANYRDCLLQIARRFAAEGREFHDLDTGADDYLCPRVDHLGQKALDLHRQAPQALLAHVTVRLTEGQCPRAIVRSHRSKRWG